MIHKDSGQKTRRPHILLLNCYKISTKITGRFVIVFVLSLSLNRMKETSITLLVIIRSLRFEYHQNVVSQISDVTFIYCECWGVMRVFVVVYRCRICGWGLFYDDDRSMMLWSHLKILLTIWAKKKVYPTEIWSCLNIESFYVSDLWWIIFSCLDLEGLDSCVHSSRKRFQRSLVVIDCDCSYWSSRSSSSFLFIYELLWSLYA